jgi:hypothetical protein
VRVELGTVRVVVEEGSGVSRSEVEIAVTAKHSKGVKVQSLQECFVG